MSLFLISLVFHMKDLSDLHYFLGIQVQRNASSLTIMQTRYLLSLLHKFRPEGAKPILTLLASGDQISAIDDVLLKDLKFYH